METSLALTLKGNKMGLDMYLTAKRYLSNFDQEDVDMSSKLNDIVRPPLDLTIKEVCATAMYWRKANAIHDWFVQNVQSGEDDCREYYVQKEKLEKLVLHISKVLNDNLLAEHLLPTCSGCFFGSDDYDDYYFECLQKTKDRIEQLLKSLDDNWEFYYQSSW
jgi:hypothetical protein